MLMVDAREDGQRERMMMMNAVKEKMMFATNWIEWAKKTSNHNDYHQNKSTINVSKHSYLENKGINSVYICLSFIIFFIIFLLLFILPVNKK